MAGIGLSLDWASALMPGLACLALAAGAAFYRSVRPDERLAAAMTATAQLVAFTAVAGPLSYAVAGSGGPLWDATFLSWDRALGLDWRAYLAFVDAHPRLGFVFTLAYQSLLPQMLLAVTVLGFSGRFTACREFVMALILAALASIAVSGITPAMAMFVQLGLDPQADFPNLDPAAAFVHVADLKSLRAGTFRVVSLRHLEGIITFPSFHAALGVIFARAFWASRWTRWPGLALNGVLIAATPIDGGHYFVDLIAGAAIAALAIAAARRLCGGVPSVAPVPVPAGVAP
ncbi:phosphatase PAP2 family protein [Methylobacterium planeticum]|uniref:Phosphatase PAP2 family protein n=2 Tax=Methylobacterium planeticum TaxID=2615211 RepID=A0A6N6MV27_9HYPH|nr:phosphatase PAP2 family protein [Methylobacterium planeticum]